MRKDFLKIFGLANLNDLPEVQGLMREASWKPAPAIEEEAESSEVVEQSAE